MPQIRKTKRMKAIEAKYGKTIEQLIREHYIDGGKTLEEMADFFGITLSTVWMWMQKFGVRTRRVMVTGDTSTFVATGTDF